MKELLAVVAIVLSVLVIYTVHQDRVRKASEVAEPPSRSVGLQSRIATPLSEVLEPYLKTLFGRLNEQQPADLVPPLQIIRERTRERRQKVEPEKHGICDAGLRCLDLMIAAAEERTQGLAAVLRISARPPSPLDAHKTGANTNTFFHQAATKRWEVDASSRKPVIEQAMAHLRSVEGVWRQAHGETMKAEDFHPRNLPSVDVQVDKTKDLGNPLEQSAYNQQRPWRRAYYDQYNQGSAIAY